MGSNGYVQFDPAVIEFPMTNNTGGQGASAAIPPLII